MNGPRFFRLKRALPSSVGAEIRRSSEAVCAAAGQPDVPGRGIESAQPAGAAAIRTSRQSPLGAAGPIGDAAAMRRVHVGRVGPGASLGTGLRGLGTRGVAALLLLGCGVRLPPPVPAVAVVTAAAAPSPDPCAMARVGQARVPALLEAGKLDRAIRVLQHAARACPAAAAEGRAPLVRALLRVGRAVEAGRVAEGIQADPQATVEAKRAADDVRAALTAPPPRAPSAAEIYRFRAAADTVPEAGLAASAPEKIEQARSLYLEAARGPQPDGDALFGAGRAASALGQGAAAQTLFDRAVVALEGRWGEFVYPDAAAEVLGDGPVVAWSNRGDQLAVGDRWSSSIFELGTWRELGRVLGQAESLAYLGQASPFLAIGYSSWTDVYDARAMRRLHTLPTGCRVSAVSPGAPRIACAADGVVSVWDYEEGAVVRSLGRLGDEVLELHFTEGGRRLITVTPYEIALWDTTRWTRTRTRPHARAFFVAYWDGDTTFALANLPEDGSDPTYELIDAATLGTRRKIPPEDARRRIDGEPAKPPGVTNLGSWSPDRQFYLVSMSHARAEIYDAAGARVPALLPLAEPAESAAFSPDGAALAIVHAGGALRLYDAKRGAPRQAPGGGWEKRAVNRAGAAWSTDGTVGVYAAAMGITVLADGGPRCAGKGEKRKIEFVAVTPDGTVAATASHGEVLHWDTTRGAVTDTLPAVPEGEPRGLAFAPEGSALGVVWHTARADDELHLVDLKTRADRLIASFASDGSHGQQVLFVPGQRAVGVADPFRLWDAETTRPLLEIWRRGSALALSSDGKTLLTGRMLDGAVRFVSLASGEVLVGLRGLREGDYAFVEGPNAGGWLARPSRLARVELFDEKAREALVCRIGPRAFQLCAERAIVPGLFAKALSGDRSYLDP